MKKLHLLFFIGDNLYRFPGLFEYPEMDPDEQEDSENWKNSPDAGVESWPFNGTEYVQFAVNMDLLYCGQLFLGI